MHVEELVHTEIHFASKKKDGSDGNDESDLRLT